MASQPMGNHELRCVGLVIGCKDICIAKSQEDMCPFSYSGYACRFANVTSILIQ